MTTTTPNATASHAYRPDIDGLRAIAVVAVILHHSFPHAIQGGFVGVDIFFVLSGYLISQKLLEDLQHGQFGIAGFYARRIRRILPALLVVMAATLAAASLVLLPLDLMRLGRHAMSAAVFASNFTLWSESGYFDAEAFRKPLLHLWSLAIEEQFYIVWPGVLWLLHRWRLGPRRAIGVVLLLSLLYSLWLLKADRTAAFYHPLSRFWELAAGALLAAHTLRAPDGGAPDNRRWRTVLAVAGLLLLTVVLVRLTPERRFPGGWALAAVVATSLLILSGPDTALHRRLLSHRVMVWVGLISYPLYLWHWPLLTLARIHHGGLPPVAQQWLWVGASVLLAWLTWRWVERPVRFGRWKRRPAVVGLLCAGLVAMAAAGFWLSRPSPATAGAPPLIQTLQTRVGEKVLTEGWRVKDCMLGFEQTGRDFKPFCTETAPRPMVFLWGDSHAGALYPGFKALQDKGEYRFGLTERTAAICPPVLGHEPRPLCQALNDSNLEDVRRLKPEIVVLYAFWHEQLIHQRYDMANFEKTIEAIRAAGAGRVVVIGDAPFWRGPLPEILLNIWKQGPPQSTPPLRLPNSFLDDHIQAYSREVQMRTERAGGEFISGLDVFCDPNGCLTRLNERASEPTTFDYGHLTVAASSHFIAQIAPRIFGNR
ncbi:acyltransferase family protein [Hydrogenophaga sp. MI9]|uniref:acyltransferase family protein n=1 Tax=Hydrogenophaga sp. MI9 TaxID=3453719 RepID=UPI003EEB4954